jgi:replicative DNA helicase
MPWDYRRKLMGILMPEDLTAKNIPHSAETEEAVLGAILIDPPSYHTVSQVLRSEDFYIHRHQMIWEAITRLQQRSSPVDFLTLTEELDQSGKLTEIGGPAYLTGLLSRVPSSLHAEAYAQIIKQAAVRRQMLAAATQVARLAYDENTDLEMAVNESVQALFNVSGQLPSSRTEPFSLVLDTFYTRLTQDARTDGFKGVATGFYKLDSLLQGLQPSDLVIVAGRPGTGKTSFLLSVIRHAVMVQHKPGLVFTLETSREQLAMRLVAQQTGIPVSDLRARQLQAGELHALHQATESLKDIPLFLDDTPSISVHQLFSICRKLHREKRLDLVVVDYLQLLSGGGRFENRVQEVSFITRQLKALACELSVPVLAAAQLSRAVEQRADKHPLLSDLRESGSIEMDADVILFIYHSQEHENSSQVDLIVAKQRNGPTGTARLEFHKPLAMFTDLAKVDGR